MLLANHPWPDAYDLAGIALAAAVLVGLPLLGYAAMVADYRAYLRSLRRALVSVRQYAATLPYWAHRPEWNDRNEPACLTALGLRLPVTREEVLAAYRQRVKTVHPDAGGAREQFARLQRHFEQAMALAEAVGPAGR